MSHKKPTPESQRPTIDELRAREKFANQTWKAVRVRGYWGNDEAFRPEFEVNISGHTVDVDEVVESLSENGNLYKLDVERTDF